MKTTLIFCLIAILSSCSGNTTLTREKNIPIDTQETEIIEASPIRIEWIWEDIPPMWCSYVTRPWDMTGSMLESIIQKHPEIGWQEDGMHFWQLVREYCTDGLWRYIFYADDKAPVSFWRYDSELDVFEWAWYNTYYTKTIPQFVRESNVGFWTRSGSTIEFSQKKIPYYPYTMNDFTFQKKENMEYCKRRFENDRWSEDNCSYDAYYSYDFQNTNTVTLDKICLYYTDNGTRKPLESCRYNPYNESLRATDQNNIKILYVWQNLVSTAEYYISIDCTRDDTSHSQIELIPDDADVEIYIARNCNTRRINQRVWNALTNKRFNIVLWFREDLENIQLYTFSDDEVVQIARAPWNYLWLGSLQEYQYKAIRNTKNPIRKWFYDYHLPGLYTQEEQESCNRFIHEIKNIHDEAIWKTAREQSEECYRNLPPIQ